MKRLEGKVAIVTGGAGGIGSATVRRLVKEGARVVVADIEAEAAERVAAECGDAAVARRFDAADTASTEAMVAFAVERFGRLDILHNNAAIVGADLALDTRVTDVPYDVWDKTLNINLRAYFVGCRTAIPHMARGGGGSIITRHRARPSSAIWRGWPMAFPRVPSSRSANMSPRSTRPTISAAIRSRPASS